MSKVEYVDYHLLVKARDLIKSSKNWITDNFGIKKGSGYEDFKYLEHDDLSEAEAYCAIGALAKAAGVTPAKASKMMAAAILAEAIPTKMRVERQVDADDVDTRVENIINYNDNGDHRRAMRWFNRAIKKAAALAGISA